VLVEEVLVEEVLVEDVIDIVGAGQSF